MDKLVNRRDTEGSRPKHMRPLHAQNQMGLTCSRVNLGGTSSPVTSTHEFHAQHLKSPQTDKTSIRIAQVIQKLECGGDVAMAVALSSYFADLGHKVDVLCLDRPTGSAHEHHWL